MIVDSSLFVLAEKSLDNSYELILECETDVDNLLSVSVNTKYYDVVSAIKNSFAVTKLNICNLKAIEHDVASKLSILNDESYADLSKFSFDNLSFNSLLSPMFLSLGSKFLKSDNDLFKWKNEANYGFSSLSSLLKNTFIKTGATLTTCGISLTEGIFNVAEGLRDAAELLCGAVITPASAIIDGGQAINGALTGKSWESLTGKLWNNIMNEVKVQHVNDSYNYIYNETSPGNFLKDNSFLFDTTRAVVSGISEVAGTVILTMATAGLSAGPTAIGAATPEALSLTSSVLGLSEGAENSWNNGATVGEGLAYGSCYGIWKGLQYLIGSKISQLNVLKLPTTDVNSNYYFTKLFNEFMRINFSSVDSASVSFIEPYLKTIYADGYYDSDNVYHEFIDEQDFFSKYSSLFNEMGGWKNVFTNAAVGGFSSLIGQSKEIFYDLRGYDFAKNYIEKGGYIEFLKGYWGDTISEDEIQRRLLNGNIRLLHEQDFFKMVPDAPKNAWGCNDGTTTFIRIPNYIKDVNMLKEIVVHESNHQLSFDIAGTIENKGILNKVYKNKQWIITNRATIAMNEVVTEYLASSSMGMNPVAYTSAVNKFIEMKRYMPELTDDLIKKAYITHDSSLISDVFSSYFHDDNAFYIVSKLFEAKDYSALDEIIMNLAKGVY